MRVFNETQRFTQWWLQAINIALVALLMYGLYKWYALGEPVGNVAANDRTGQIVAILAVVCSVPLIYLFRLKTTIDEIGIHYQFFPINLSQRTIHWSEMENCYVRTYNPIKEFGGWGYRGSFGKGKAVNIKGNKGIQVAFKDGKKLLIGTQEQEDAQKVIERYFKTKDE
jgi:hypothetical protein